MRSGLVWPAPSKVNNTHALAMRRADAAAKGIGSISDLAFKVGAGEEFRLASIVEFVTRADKLKPLEKTVPRSSSASEMWSRWKPRPTPIK